MDDTGEIADLANVDEAGSAERYARLIALVSGQAHELKERVLALLAPRPGERVLDVGTGTGEDAISLALRVAPGGHVVGLDKSQDLLDKARAAAAGRGVEVDFRHGDAHALDHPDASFDACRAERVLQHLDDPAAALGEMFRVTRPGGRVLVIDADYDTLCVDASDRAVTRAVVQRRAEAAPNGWIGRQLPRLFRDAGLEVVTVEGATFTCTDHELGMEIFELDRIVEQAVAAGEIARDRADAWQGELAQRGAAGRFFLASTGYVVLGRKPS